MENDAFEIEHAKMWRRARYPCSACGGEGKIRCECCEDCDTCNGTGECCACERDCLECDGLGYDSDNECEICEGEGKYKCKVCAGTGTSMPGAAVMKPLFGDEAGNGKEQGNETN